MRRDSSDRALTYAFVCKQAVVYIYFEQPLYVEGMCGHGVYRLNNNTAVAVLNREYSQLNRAIL